MKKYNLALLTFATLGMLSCKNDKNTNENGMNSTSADTTAMDMENDMEEEMKEITVEMESKSGSNATGTVTFEQADGEVMMTANISGLEPGTHAIHIHENADCSADDATSAGGHWNPTNEKHGKWGDDEGYHKGDIGNFEADAEGNGSISMSTDEWCIGCDNPDKNIMDKGMIVHQGADDFESQPSGAAGGRVSCGGIIQ